MYKVLIADDEEIECKALEMMLHNFYEDLTILPSAENGIVLVRSVELYQPDILIVDINMPEMNGLEAIELIRMKNKRIKIIINTAYSEFDYVRKAFRSDVVDYLLKPIKSEELIRTINRIRQQLDSENIRADREKESLKQNEEMKEMIGEELVTSVILGETNRKSFEFYLRLMEREFVGAVMLSVSFVNPVRDPGSHMESEDWMRTLFRQMSQYCCCMGKMYREMLHVLFFPDSQINQNNYREWMGSMAEILGAAIEKHGGGKLCCGVSTWKYEIDEIHLAFTESRIVLENKQEPGIYFYERTEDIGNPFRGMADTYIQMLKQGEWEKCTSDIRETMRSVDISADAVSAVRVYALDLMHRIYEAAAYEADIFVRYGKENQIEWSELMQCHTKKEISEWMTSCTEHIGEIFSKKKKSGKTYIERAILYMEENYMQDIPLAQAAEFAGISSFYLSRLLKQELDQNFTEILTTIRIRHAMILLRNRDNTVKDIAKQVGFLNTSYFYKVFKKSSGMNIGEMKDILGRDFA